MTRLKTGITFEELARRCPQEVTVERLERPTPPSGEMMFRCAHVIYRRKSEWRAACMDREHPTSKCLCHALGVPLKPQPIVTIGGRPA